MCQKCILIFTYSTRYSFQILINLEFSRKIFEKYSNIEFPFGGGRVPGERTDRRTDRHDGANILFFFAILEMRLKIHRKGD